MILLDYFFFSITQAVVTFSCNCFTLLTLLEDLTGTKNVKFLIKKHVVMILKKKAQPLIMFHDTMIFFFKIGQTEELSLRCHQEARYLPL